MFSASSKVTGRRIITTILSKYNSHIVQLTHWWWSMWFWYITLKNDKINNRVSSIKRQKFNIIFKDPIGLLINSWIGQHSNHQVREKQGFVQNGKFLVGSSVCVCWGGRVINHYQKKRKEYSGQLRFH